MKRLVLAAVLLSAVGSLGSARASRCASAGEFDQVYVKYGSVEIYGYQFGNFATGPASVCDDASVNVEPASHGELTITVNGVEVCHRTDTRVSADPFGFGIGIHATGGSCGADVSLGNLAWATVEPETFTDAYAPGMDPAAAGAGGAHAGAMTMSPVTGHFWIDDADTSLPLGHPGWYSRGARVALS